MKSHQFRSANDGSHDVEGSPRIAADNVARRIVHRFCDGGPVQRFDSATDSRRLAEKVNYHGSIV